MGSHRRARIAIGGRSTARTSAISADYLDGWKQIAVINGLDTTPALKPPRRVQYARKPRGTSSCRGFAGEPVSTGTSRTLVRSPTPCGLNGPFTEA